MAGQGCGALTVSGLCLSWNLHPHPHDRVGLTLLGGKTGSEPFQILIQSSKCPGLEWG